MSIKSLVDLVPGWLWSSLPTLGSAALAVFIAFHGVLGKGRSEREMDRFVKVTLLEETRELLSQMFSERSSWHVFTTQSVEGGAPLPWTEEMDVNLKTLEDDRYEAYELDRLHGSTLGVLEACTGHDRLGMLFSVKFNNGLGELGRSLDGLGQACRQLRLSSGAAASTSLIELVSRVENNYWVRNADLVGASSDSLGNVSGNQLILDRLETLLQDLLEVQRHGS